MVSGAGGAAGIGGATSGLGGSPGSGGSAGSPGAAGSPGGGGIGGTPGAAGINGQAGAGGAGPSSAGGQAGGGSGKVGVVIVSQSAQVIPTLGTIVGAGVVADFGFVAGKNSCTSTTSGDCQLLQCAASTNPPPQFLSAGTVTVTGLAMDVSVVPTSGANGPTYISSPYMGYLWTASRPTTTTVMGSADVPAFTLSSTAPNPISVTAPVAQAGLTGSTYTISRGAALPITWTGGIDGNVTASLTSGKAPSQVEVVCVVAASKGTVTVPASFMSMLGASGGFSAGVSTFVTKNVGDWLMEFEASTIKDQGLVTYTP